MVIVDVPNADLEAEKKKIENTTAKMINDQREIFIFFLW